MIKKKVCIECILEMIRLVVKGKGCFMKIIAVGAHLDDIELACGGTLLKAIQHGHKVKMVVMSQSGYKDFNGVVKRTNEDAVKEGINAAHALGVSDIEILDFVNKNIPYGEESVEALDKIMDRFKPDIIFTHWPFDTHQDHVNTAKATISAARRYNTIYMYEPIAPSGRSYQAFRPQVYVDISDQIDEKLASLEAHKTELSKFGEDWIMGVKSRAGFRGYEMGTKYGEVFELLREELHI